MPKQVSQAVVEPEDEEVEAPLAVVAEPPNEEGKVKMIMGLLKKFMGVKDIANLRLSLPASLMEPVPNLEYIGDSPDPLERMLAALRFAFTIQLKFVRGKVCKPYNSVLGEHFRCHWEVPPNEIDPSTLEPVVNGFLHQHNVGDPAISGYNTPGNTTPSIGDRSDASSVRSGRSLASSLGGKAGQEFYDAQDDGIPSVTGGSVSGTAFANGVKPVKVAFLCEQVSHHPPISSAYYYCPDKGIEVFAIDQIAAKVSGMSIRIGPGSLNKGTFVKLNQGPGKGEEYQISNPQANVNGLLKGTFYGTISDQVSVTCRGGDSTERYRAITEYKDESWISKPRFLLEGIVYKYKAGDAVAENYVKIKDVPPAMVVGTLEGCWRTKVNFKAKGEKESRLLIDLDVLAIVPKRVRPLSSQDDFESRKLWDPVTQKMLSKAWGDATSEKQKIEQQQRDRTAERKVTGEEFIPKYFDPDLSDGRPRLTEEGKRVVALELEGDGY
ncbi:hypothetical protein BDY24DRAFT_413768 [Mrakia frigida]|uniref:uncharacterized protein n=1 Tax=Mrakia frigida TaxID=29902 RepID=UPI003FCC1581